MFFKDVFFLFWLLFINFTKHKHLINKINQTISAYKNKELTLSEAASLANISYREFRNKLIEKNIKTDFDSVGTNIEQLILDTKN